MQLYSFQIWLYIYSFGNLHFLGNLAFLGFPSSEVFEPGKKNSSLEAYFSCGLANCEILSLLKESYATKLKVSDPWRGEETRPMVQRWPRSYSNSFHLSSWQQRDCRVHQKHWMAEIITDRETVQGLYFQEWIYMHGKMWEIKSEKQEIKEEVRVLSRKVRIVKNLVFQLKS